MPAIRKKTCKILDGPSAPTDYDCILIVFNDGYDNNNKVNTGYYVGNQWYWHSTDGQYIVSFDSGHPVVTINVLAGYTFLKAAYIRANPSSGGSTMPTLQTRQVTFTFSGISGTDGYPDLSICYTDGSGNLVEDMNIDQCHNDETVTLDIAEGTMFYLFSGRTFLAFTKAGSSVEFPSSIDYTGAQESANSNDTYVITSSTSMLDRLVCNNVIVDFQNA